LVNRRVALQEQNSTLNQRNVAPLDSPAVGALISDPIDCPFLTDEVYIPLNWFNASSVTTRVEKNTWTDWLRKRAALTGECSRSTQTVALKN